MLPRHRLDISFRDLAFALLACVIERDRERTQERVATLAEDSAIERPLVCLSLRSAFDTLLTALDFDPGSELVMSAVNHPDMASIARLHGLRTLPVDLDPATMAPRVELVERACTQRTVAIVVAHLFGGRADLERLADFAHRHGLLLIEDNAQAFRGPADSGDRRADVSLFSFGSIKTATALGGALVYIRDQALRARVEERVQAMPLQPRAEFAGRTLKFTGLVLLSNPLAFGVLVKALRVLRVDLDEFVYGRVRGIAADSADPRFVATLRRRPSTPLLALMHRRLRRFDFDRLERRRAIGERLVAAMPPGVESPGSNAPVRTHWVLPAVVSDPAAVAAALREHGFDVSRSTTSIATIRPPEDRPELAPAAATQIMNGVVFLPAYPELPDSKVEQLAELLPEIASSQQSPATLHIEPSQATSS